MPPPPPPQQQHQQFSATAAAIAAAAAAAVEPNANDGGALASPGPCVVCLDKLSRFIVWPCCHICLCADCAAKKKRKALKKCPVCRKPVRDIRQIYVA